MSEELTIEELEGRVELLETRVESLESILEDTTNALDALKADQRIETRPADPGPPAKLVPEATFESGDKTYRFLVAQFVYNREIVKAVDALEAQELLDEIVEKYGTLVEEV